MDLDADLHGRLRRLVPPRGLDRFINQAVAEKLAALERQQIAQAMIEGYVATRAEREALNPRKLLWTSFAPSINGA